MEEHEKQILAHNLDKLTTCTDCSFKFLAKFLLSANISEEEAEELTELKSNKTNQARRFYDIFISGNRDYQRLLTVLRETNQSEALKILTSVKLEDEGKLSLTFKEKLTLKNPGENVLESSSLELEAINLNNLNIDNLSLYGATLLGRGMYDAFVYKHKFNKADRAIKSISNKHLDIEKATSEVEEILKLGNHQNVIKVILGKELNNHRFIIVMELCIASLLDWIEQKQPFIRPQEILRQATTGLVFLHDNLITHGNLKPTNILLYPDKRNIIRIKLSDFLPKRKRNLNRSTITLFESDTLGWMAPEVIHDFNNHEKRTEITVTSATDVFSLGCLFYFVMTEGRYPFGDRIRRPVNILQSHYVVSLNDVAAVLPSNICVAICMTNKNPMLRPTAKSLLSHHIFWSAEKTLQFISQISECCHEKSISISNCIQRLEASSTYVLGDNSETLNWTNQLSPSLHSSIKEYEQTLTHTINSTSILDLINAIKHFSGLPSKFPHEMGDSADEILGYWTSKRFPFLIPIIWKAFEVMKDDQRLATFYDNFLASNYEVIDAINLLGNTSTSDKVLNYPGSWENEGSKTPEKKYRQTSFNPTLNNTQCQVNDGSSTESSTLSLLIAEDATSKSSKKKRKKLNKHGRSNPTKKLGKTEHKLVDKLRKHAKPQEETTVYKAEEESSTQVSDYGEQKETDIDKEISGSFCSEHKVSDSSWSDTDEDLCSDDYENGEKKTDHKYHAGNDEDFDACNESDGNDKPLELIVFQSDAKEDNSGINVQLNQINLDIVLQSTEDKPLCVISVVGPPRTGKSLLLNYIKLSLEALEDGDKSFDIANVDKPVSGFAWNANYDPQTKGIWVWSRAFLIDTTGKGVAVILLDTQGFNENTSSPQEISSILGLSMLSSSITIYNLESDIPTEAFKSLAPVFQYGLLCKETDEQSTDNSPFQKLSFLVRDWNNPSKYKHSEEGGKLLLKQKVRSLKGNLKKITLNALRNCFHQVDSYLMPNIGQYGIPESFSGATVELDPDFASHLKLYLDNLLGKRNLHAQKVLGKNVTASEYASFMQAFCKFFSGSSKAGDLVNENDLFKVRCQTLHENIVVKSLGKYHRIMNKKLKLSKYTTGKELCDTDKIARNQAISIFKRASKLEEFKEEFEKRLEHQLEKAFEELRCNNSLSMTSHVTECIQNSKEVFKNLLTNKLPFDNHQATIYDDEYIYMTTNKAMETVTENFLQIFLDEDDKSLQDLQKSLRQELVSIRKSFLEQNNLSKNKAYEIVRDISSKIIQEYEDTMNHLLSDFPLVELALLRQSHCMNFTRALATFDNCQKPSNSGIIQTHRKEIIAMLEKVFNNLSEKQNEKIGAKMEEGYELVKLHVDGYTKAIKTKAQKSSSLEELQEIHAEASLNIIEKFRSINPFPEDSTQHELLNITMQGQLRVVLDVVKGEELDRMRKLEDKLEKAVGNGITDCLKEYEDAIKESVIACELLEDFNQEHEKHKLNTEKSFNSKWSSVYKRELRIEMDTLFKEFKELFETQQRSDNESTTLLKEEIRKYYHEDMEKHLKNQKLIQPKVLETLHDRAVQSALSRCVNKRPLKEPQITSIKQALQMSYEKYKDQNTMKLNWELGSGPAIGIDLGTENCCVAAFLKGEIIAVRNAEGKVTTPSYVTFEQNGSYKIGQVAKDTAFQNPESTVYEAKRLIGRNIQDEQFMKDIINWPFSVVDGEKGPAIEIYGKQYLPEQIAAFLLKHLVSEAEKFLGVAIKKAVITVPAYFTDTQRAATADAGEMAGLEVLQILDEPAAAALAYKLYRYYEVSRKALVFDLGGGTFDVTILDINGSQIKILNKDGDPNLRAEIFDKSLMEYCSTEFKKQHDVDPFQVMNSMLKPEKDAAMRRYRRLLTYCERGKLNLDSSSETVISVDAFYNSTDLNVVVTRQIFEEINESHFKKALDIVERSLKNVNLSKDEIDDIILVGGSSRIPKVQQMLAEYFKGKDIINKVSTEEVVACGAAVQAALLNGRVLLQDLKLESIENVTPMSIGIEENVYGIDGSFSPIIPKNTKIPTTAKMVYKTFKDNQQTAMIKIFQGESPLAKANQILAEFTVRGIPPGPAGKESVDITLEIDAMWVLSITAVVGSTGVKQCLTITENKHRRMSRLKKQELLAEVSSLNS